MSLERKLRRKKANKAKKKSEKELATKVALFGKLPNKCLTCDKPFDKLNREQVMTWNVVVRKDTEKVNLYCPDCWQKANEILEDFRKKMFKKKLPT